MARIGYARVSTNDQHPEAQADRLREAGCERVFTDHGVSGKLASRPQWDAVLEYVRPGDALVITKLDRAGRSVKHLCDVAARLREPGVDLVVLDQGIDTSTAPGKLMFHVLAAIADFERDLISERTRDGLAAMPGRGRSGGRKAALAPYQVEYAHAQVDKGVPIATIAGELGVHRATIYRALAPAATES